MKMCEGWHLSNKPTLDLYKLMTTRTSPGKYLWKTTPIACCKDFSYYFRFLCALCCPYNTCVMCYDTFRARYRTVITTDIYSNMRLNRP